MTALARPEQDYTVASVLFHVPGSKPGTDYTVACDPVTGRVLDCTCPHAIYRRAFCKHQKLIATRDHGGIKPRVRIVMHNREAAPATNTVWQRARLASDLYA